MYNNQITGTSFPSVRYSIDPRGCFKDKQVYGLTFKDQKLVTDTIEKADASIQIVNAGFASIWVKYEGDGTDRWKNYMTQPNIFNGQVRRANPSTNTTNSFILPPGGYQIFPRSINGYFKAFGACCDNDMNSCLVGKKPESKFFWDKNNWHIKDQLSFSMQIRIEENEPIFATMLANKCSDPVHNQFGNYLGCKTLPPDIKTSGKLNDTDNIKIIFCDSGLEWSYYHRIC